MPTASRGADVDVGLVLGRELLMSVPRRGDDVPEDPARRLEEEPGPVGVTTQHARLAPKWVAIRCAAASGTALEMDSSATLSMMLTLERRHPRREAVEEGLVRAMRSWRSRSSASVQRTWRTATAASGADALGKAAWWTLGSSVTRTVTIAAARLVDVQAAGDVGMLREVVPARRAITRRRRRAVV